MLNVVLMVVQRCPAFVLLSLRILLPDQNNHLKLWLRQLLLASWYTSTRFRLRSSYSWATWCRWPFIEYSSIRYHDTQDHSWVDLQTSIPFMESSSKSGAGFSTSCCKSMAAPCDSPQTNSYSPTQILLQRSMAKVLPCPIKSEPYMKPSLRPESQVC